MRVDQAQIHRIGCRGFFLGQQIVAHLHKSIEWMHYPNERPLRFSELIGSIDVNCPRERLQHQLGPRQVWLRRNVQKGTKHDFLFLFFQKAIATEMLAPEKFQPVRMVPAVHLDKENHSEVESRCAMGQEEVSGNPMCHVHVEIL
jgi:hypothetical protein